MKLSTSTGDFGKYVPTLTEEIRHFRGSPFRYINLEQNTADYFLCPSDDPWRREVDDWAKAAEDAGVTFVFSHAPCMNAFSGSEEDYQTTVRAIRRSIRSCALLNIDRIVVHASFSPTSPPVSSSSRTAAFMGISSPQRRSAASCCWLKI